MNVAVGERTGFLDLLCEVESSVEEILIEFFKSNCRIASHITRPNLYILGKDSCVCATVLDGYLRIVVLGFDNDMSISIITDKIQTCLDTINNVVANSSAQRLSYYARFTLDNFSVTIRATAIE